LNEIDVSSNTALIALHCNSNSISSLDLSQNLLLGELNCESNQLTNLNLLNNTALYYINCGFNQLTNLNVSMLTELRTLNCYYTQLTSLDLSQNLQLSRLICHNNPMTNLDLSYNINLTDLSCRNSQLNSLNVKNGNNANVNTFNALSNNLICITVDDESADNSSWEVDPRVYLSNDCDLSHPGSYLIQGTVTSSEDGTALAGVSIIEQGTSYDLVTSFDGNYAMTISGDGAVLIVSLVGYLTEEVHVGNRETVNIILTPDPDFSPIGDGTVIVDGNVTLYPNPVVDWLTIEFTDLTVVLDDVIINVYDELANFESVQTIESVSVYGLEADFNDLGPGTYYVQLYDGIEVRVFRIIKE
jgi:hypothetical protein